MTANKGKLEVFELIAEDDTTESYLARLRGSQWIVLRRGRDEDATKRLGEIATLAHAILDAHVVRTFAPGADLGRLHDSVLLEEYIEGERLSDWLDVLEKKPLPWRVAAAIVRDAALGAWAIQSACPGQPRAAAQLWPGRIAIGFDGSVKVIDPCAELRGVTAPGRPALGTVDASTAVLSLGHILEALRAPATLIDSDFVPPKAFERVLQRATATSPTERFRNASELAVALDALLDDPTPIEAYFAERFAAERNVHAETMAALDGTMTLEMPSLRDLSGSGETFSMPIAAPTVQDLLDYDETGETEQLRLDDLLGDFAADADEDIRTRPFRRELLSKLKRTERVTLERGGERVAVVSTPVQPARMESTTPDENVIVDPNLTPLMPPVSTAPNSTDEEAPLVSAAVVQAALEQAAKTPPPARRTFEEPPPNSGATVMIRAIDVRGRNRSRDFVALAIAALVVAAIAFYVFR